MYNCCSPGKDATREHPGGHHVWNTIYNKVTIREINQNEVDNFGLNVGVKRAFHHIYM